MADKNNIDVTASLPPNLFAVGRIVDIFADYNQGQDSKLVGGISVSITTPENAIYDIGQDHENVGSVSLDAIFCPYTTESGHLRLPYWEKPDSGAATPTSTELNPFFPLGIAGSDALTYYESGSNVAAFNSLSAVGDGTQEDMSPHAQIHDHGTVGSFARGVGLRSPIVVTGPGYNTDGNPVPPDTGTVYYDTSGNPVATGDSTKFSPDAFTNPNKWKSGPVDLRWDESRKVWVTSGGGGAEVIQFIVDSPGVVTGTDSLVSPDPGQWAITDFVGCHYVVGTVSSIGCDTTSVSVGETGVRIFDENACFFNLPAHLLIGMRGTAQKMRNPYHNASVEDVASGILSCVSESYLAGPCRWVVTGLCCGEEVL